MNEYESTVNDDNSDELMCGICGDTSCDAGGICERCLKKEMESLKTDLFVADDWKEPQEVCGKDCPWSTTGSYGVDMGCLPHPTDFIKAATERNEILSCHSDLTRPCTGIKDYLERRGFNISGMKLVENAG